MYRVREIRKQRGWSQVKLAEEAGLRQVTISNLERGEHSPTIETLQKIADALGVQLIELFAESGGPKKGRTAPGWVATLAPQWRELLARLAISGDSEGDIALLDLLRNHLVDELEIDVSEFSGWIESAEPREVLDAFSIPNGETEAEVFDRYAELMTSLIVAFVGSAEFVVRAIDRLAEARRTFVSEASAGQEVRPEQIDSEEALCDPKIRRRIEDLKGRVERREITVEEALAEAFTAKPRSA